MMRNLRARESLDLTESSMRKKEANKRVPEIIIKREIFVPGKMLIIMRKRQKYLGKEGMSGGMTRDSIGSGIVSTAPKRPDINNNRLNMLLSSHLTRSKVQVCCSKLFINKRSKCNLSISKAIKVLKI